MKFVKGRRAKCFAIKRLDTYPRGRAPYRAASWHGVEGNVADLVGLKAADELEIVAQLVVELGVERPAGAAALRGDLVRDHGRILLGAGNAVEQRAGRQPVLWRERDEVGPFGNEFIGISRRARVRDLAECCPREGHIEVHVPVLSGLVVVAEIREVSRQARLAHRTHHECRGLPFRKSGHETEPLKSAPK